MLVLFDSITGSMLQLVPGCIVITGVELNHGFLCALCALVAVCFAVVWYVSDAASGHRCILHTACLLEIRVHLRCFYSASRSWPECCLSLFPRFFCASCGCCPFAVCRTAVSSTLGTAPCPGYRPCQLAIPAELRHAVQVSWLPPHAPRQCL